MKWGPDWLEEEVLLGQARDRSKKKPGETLCLCVRV